MGEYFILVNESKREYIDPDRFPNRLAIKHVGWMTANHACIILHLLTDSEFTRTAPPHDSDWCAAWAGDTIRFLGDSTDRYSTVTETYRDVSTAVYRDVNASYPWFPSPDSA